MVDEGGDLPLQASRQEVMLEQDAVLHGLVPALDLALGLGMIGRAAQVQQHVARIGPATKTTLTRQQPEQLDLFEALDLKKPA